ncbi:lipase family protein [uncultured Pseudodesulfovibrio sp.]|uniref:lipase family protein n=1 Tax=uncultured Pseudodesulfovibrio sp. TaxID=2035858 RepID=UPI0029C9B17A|nr:lipase family protein [uncultured Pseudodesulfovibrio sp.]
MSYFRHSQLLAAPPVKRAAYSDRTAWIMAELSRLVYDRLPNEKELQDLFDKIVAGIREKKSVPELLPLAAELAASANEARDSMTEEILTRSRFELVSSYACSGTEAMLVRVPPAEDAGFPGMLIVVFRGTEVKSTEDLKTDFNASLIDAPSGGRVHKGFYEAYQQAEEWLSKELAQAGDLPVYVTGHSLGGALALVTTRYLCCDSIGATYTFGGPRVGDDEFFKGVKTPVYRVVNAADLVARVPFGAGFTFFLSIIRYIPINGTKRISEYLRSRFNGYTHYGHQLLLSAKKNSDGIFPIYCSPSIFKIAQVSFVGLARNWWKKCLADHSMIIYCEKLGDYALHRIK